MDPEYYALVLQNGERIVPPQSELDRVFRDNARAVRTMGKAMPAYWRRFLRATAAPKAPALRLQPKPPAAGKRDPLAFLEALQRRAA